MAVRTGLPTAVALCRKFCKLLAVFKPSIIAAINASALSSEDKATAIATLNAIDAGCDAFTQLAVKFE
jgi:hypothetical protein